MKKIELKISGMHCGSCSMLIADVLEEEEGIKDLQVSYEKGMGIVKFDETKIEESKIKLLIEKEGFEVE